MFSSSKRPTDEERTYRRRQQLRYPAHACELPVHPSRIFRKLPPNSSLWMRIRRFIQKRVMAWSRWRALRRLRPSTCALEKEQAKYQYYRRWWVIHPYSKLFAFWQLLMIATISYRLLIIPLYYCLLGQKRFLEWPPIEHSIDIPYLNESDERTIKFKEDMKVVTSFIWNGMRIVDVVFYLHMIVVFLTGYYDEKEADVVMKPSKIISRYLTTWFFPDMLTSLNYIDGRDKFVFTQYDMTNKIWYNRYNMWITEMLIFINMSRLHYVLEYVRNWCKMANIPRIITNLIIYLLCFTSFLNFGTYLVVKIPLLVRGRLLFNGKSTCWVMDKEIGFFDVAEPHLLLRQYLLALHKVLSLCLKSFPHFSTHEQTKEDRIVVISLIWITTAFSVVLMAMVVGYVETLNSNKIELTKVNHQVQAFIRHNKLPEDLRRKVEMHYRRTYTNSYFAPFAIVENLPPSMRTAIRHATGSRIIRNSHIFEGVPKSLINRIVSALRDDIFLPNEVVYSSGSYANCLFFLNVGTVALYLNTGEEVGHLEDGSFFGEMGLVLPERNRRHLESVVSLEMCEVFRLNSADFDRLIRPVARLYNRLRAAAMLRATEVYPLGYENEELYGYSSTQSLDTDKEKELKFFEMNKY